MSQAHKASISPPDRAVRHKVQRPEDYPRWSNKGADEFEPDAHAGPRHTLGMGRSGPCSITQRQEAEYQEGPKEADPVSPTDPIWPEFWRQRLRETDAVYVCDARQVTDHAHAW